MRNLLARLFAPAPTAPAKSVLRLESLEAREVPAVVGWGVPKFGYVPPRTWQPFVTATHLPTADTGTVNIIGILIAL